jgi:hypothetical protein
MYLHSLIRLWTLATSIPEFIFDDSPHKLLRLLDVVDCRSSGATKRHRRRIEQVAGGEKQHSKNHNPHHQQPLVISNLSPEPLAQGRSSLKMLTDKIRLSGPETNDPEDILSSSLGVIFPDDSLYPSMLFSSLLSSPSD